MKHQIIEGKIQSLGDRNPFAGKTRINNLVIKKTDGEVVAFSDIIVENEIVRILSPGDEIVIAVATFKKLFGGKINIVTAIKNAQIVDRNAEYSFGSLVTIFFGLAAIALISRGLLVPIALVAGYYIYRKYNREKTINNLSHDAYESLLKLP